nr:MAG TPA: putative cytoplasmic protein [Caudoviricetes sp.]
MAKDWDDDIDNLEDFEEFDFDDLDDEGGGSKIDVMDGKGRNPVANSIKKAYNAAVDEVKSKRVRDHAMGVMEKSLSSDGQAALSDLKSKIRETGEDVGKAFDPLRKSLKDLTKGLADVTPTGGRLNSIFKKLNDKLTKDDERIDSGFNQQANAFQEFKEEIGGSFNAMQSQLQSVVEQAQKSQGMGSLLQQGNAIQNIIKEQNRIYYTKSLELQWRIATATEESNKIAREQFEGYTKILNTIVHNTALPEAVKITNSEMAMQNLKNRAFNTLSTTVFKQVMPIDKIRTNLINKLREKLETFEEGATGLGDLVGMSQDLKEAGMGTEAMIGSQLGTAVLNKLYGVGAKFIPRKYKGKMEQGIMGLLADPMAYLKAQRQNNPNGLLGKLFNKAVGGLDDLVGDTGPGRTNIKLNNTNLSAQAIFDGRTHSSINIVIPRLLSKIHAEVHGLRTGTDVKEGNELRFDHTTGGFITKNKATELFAKDLNEFTIRPAKESAKGIKKHIVDVLKNVELPDKDKVLSMLDKVLLAYISKKGNISPDALTSADFLAYYPGELQLQAAGLFKQFIFELQNKNKLGSTYQVFKAANDIFKFSPQAMQQRIGGMNTDIAREFGILEVNRHTGESSISAKGMSALMDRTHRLKANRVNSRINTYFDDEIDWANDARATLNGMADAIQRRRDGTASSEPDYFTEGGTYTDEFGNKIVRTGNVLTDEEMANSENAIKKRLEIEEFMNSDAMLKLKTSDPDKYNKELAKFKRKMDEKYDRSWSRTIRNGINKTRDVLTGNYRKFQEDKGDRSTLDYLKDKHEEALQNSTILKAVETGVRDGIATGMGAIKAGTDKFRATETGQKIESTINQAIEDVTGSEMFKSGKAKFVKLKGSLTKRQKQVEEIIKTHITDKDQYKAAVAYIKSLDRNELDRLMTKAKSKAQAAMDGGEDYAILALRAMAGDEFSKEVLKANKDKALSMTVEGLKTAKAKGIEGAAQLDSKARAILKEHGIESGQDFLDKVSRDGKKMLSTGKTKLKKVVDDLKTTNPFTSGQSIDNVTNQAELKARLMVKHGDKLSTRQGMVRKGVRRFIKLFSSASGSTATMESTPYKSLSGRDMIKETFKGLTREGTRDKIRSMDPNELAMMYGKALAERAFGGKGTTANADAPSIVPSPNMTPSQFKQLREDALKAGKDSDEYKKFRQDLQKSILERTKKQANKAVQAGAMTPEDKKNVLQAVENLDEEQLKDPFFIFSIFKNLGGIAKWTAGLSWETAKTAIKGIPQFWKSGFAKSMRQKEREFYKGLWQRAKRGVGGIFGRKPKPVEQTENVTPETAEQKAMKRKGSWAERLAGFAKKVLPGGKKEGEGEKKKGFFDKLKALFKPLLFAVPIILGKIFDFVKPIGKVLHGIWTAVKPVAKILWDLLKWVGKLGGKLLGGAISAVGGAAKGLWNVGKKVGGAVSGAAVAGGSWLADKVKGAASWVGDKFSAAKKWIGSSTIGQKAGELLDSGKKALGGMWDKAKGFFSSAKSTAGSMVAEASEKLTKSSIIGKILKVAETFKNKITSKFGKKAGATILAKLAVKTGARLNPFTGPALLAWDAGWILGYLGSGMSLSSAISKQLLGFDLFDDSDTATDEDGNPVQPDAVEETEKKAEEAAKKVDESIAKDNEVVFNKTTVGDPNGSHYSEAHLKINSENSDLAAIISAEKALNKKKKGNLSGSELLQRQFSIAFSLLKPEERSVELVCTGLDLAKRNYGEYSHGSYTLGEADPEIVWDAKSYPDIKIGKMISDWWKLGFGAKDNFDAIDVKDYVKDVKEWCSALNMKTLLDPQSPSFDREYVILLAHKIKAIKEAVIAKAKKLKGKSYDSAIAYIVDQDHQHADGGGYNDKGKKDEPKENVTTQDNTAPKNEQNQPSPLAGASGDTSTPGCIGPDCAPNPATPANNANFNPNDKKALQNTMQQQKQAQMTTPKNNTVATTKSIPKPAVSSAVANSAPGSTRAEKAATYASRHHEGPKSTGYCARYVANSLENAGYKFTRQESAYMYATNGIMSKMGFTQIDPNTPPRNGDIYVFGRNKSKGVKHGHIQIYKDGIWYSDFKQNGGARYRPYNSPGDKYVGIVPTMWRDMGDDYNKKQEELEKKNEAVVTDSKPDNVAPKEGKENASAPSEINVASTDQGLSIEGAPSGSITTGTASASVSSAAPQGAAASPTGVQPQRPTPPMGQMANQSNDLTGLETTMLDGNKTQLSQLSKMETTNMLLKELIDEVKKEPTPESTRVQDVRERSNNTLAANPPVSSTQPPTNKSALPANNSDMRKGPVFSTQGA